MISADWGPSNTRGAAGLKLQLPGAVNSAQRSAWLDLSFGVSAKATANLTN